MKYFYRNIISSYLLKNFAVLLGLWLWSFSALAQENQQKLPDKVRLMFLLDGSGSMLAPWEKGELRIDVAKRMLSDLVDSLKSNEKVELALRVYGHQYHRRYQNCKDTRLEAPFRAMNHDLIKQKLAQIQPQGTTPIAYSLEQAAKDFPQDDNARNVIIIITDGLESCDGDPCAVSKELQKKNIFLKPFVIGLGMKEEFGEQLECLGQYFNASDTETFRDVLNQALKQTLEKTTVSVELLDELKKPTETNVNVTFVNNITQEPVFNFVHYLDPRGRPDSVEVDAVLSYDIVVNTIPPVIKPNVAFKGGEHNLLRIQAPQGQLKIQQNGHTEYGRSLTAIVRRAGSMQTLNLQQVEESEKYLAGRYDLEVFTVPRTYRYGVEVKPGQMNSVQVESPGVLNILGTKFPGIGSLYKVHANGSQEWIMDLPEGNPRQSQALQPGNYRLVFRAFMAKGSKYTIIRDFTIKSGASATINLFGK
jgi:Ca-activated chloride channel homolog